MLFANRSVDADNIEAVVYIMELMPASILASNTTNLSLLGWMDSLFRPTMSLMRSGLHLDERKRITVPANQIDFAEGFAIVAGNDLVAVPTQIAIGLDFTGRTLLLVEEVALMLVVPRVGAKVQSDTEAGPQAL